LTRDEPKGNSLPINSDHFRNWIAKDHMSDSSTDSSIFGEDEDLLARVAWYYYHDGLTQNAIGEKLGLARIKVSRILDAGQRSGLLQVKINSSLQNNFELERALADHYGLEETRVIPPMAGLPPSERLAQAAAQFLMQRLPPKSLLAVGWGEMVSAAIRRLGHLSNERKFDFVSMTGGVQSYVDGMRVVGLDRKVYLVPAPLICNLPETAALLLKESSVVSVLRMSLSADYALVGIGALNENASVVRVGCVHPAELPAMRRLGAVGDVLCRFIDAHGQEVSLPIHDRVVGLSLEQLKTATKLIAAAAGADKVEAIRAALTGKFIKIFITDEPTAKALLE
jgi:lsr operon transcriptional repressor